MKWFLVCFSILAFNQPVFSMGKSKNPYAEYTQNVESLNLNLKKAVTAFGNKDYVPSCEALNNSVTDLDLITQDLKALSNKRNEKQIEEASNAMVLGLFFIFPAAVSCGSGFSETKTHADLIEGVAAVREVLIESLLSVRK